MRAAALGILLLAPMMAGCVEELVVALRVGPGETRTLVGHHAINGSIVIEPGGRLVLDHARVDVAQRIVVQGALESRESLVHFDGSVGTPRLDVAPEGEAAFTGGGVGPAHLAVAGRLASDATSWRVLPRAVIHGEARFEGGVVDVAGGDRALAVEGGALRLGNLTLRIEGQEGLAVSGDAEAWGVTFEVPRLHSFADVRGGTLLLVDSPYPRNAQAPRVDEGRLVVAWTLTLRATTLPGNAPIAGLPVTLTSAHGDAPAQATTDAAGDARFVAVQYVYGGNVAGSRTGNPHVATADEGGKRGATPALVVESPTRVVLPVVDSAEGVEVALPHAPEPRLGVLLPEAERQRE